MAEGSGEDDIPRDAKIVKSLLNSMGVTDYEPRVVQQFLELWYRYVTDVLIDSQVYSEHAGKSSIDYDDVKLAIQSKVNFSHSQPPPREMLLELGRSINKNPLRLSVAGRRNHLPPVHDTLINPNYHLALSRKLNLQATTMAVEETEEEEDEKAIETNSNPSSQEQRANASLQAATPQQRVSFPLVQKRK